MDAKLLIEINRKELRDAQAQGLTSVSTSTLHAIFDKMELSIAKGPAEPNAIELEKFRSLTYFSQLCYDGNKPWQHRAGVALHVLTSLAAASALLVFLWGARLAYLGFVAFAP